ncbi:hypothetical protein HY969_04285 [Candidatus Kaiserbacteria bacterium]|nr:hypothetical protein [Candidatus Kaiserbacteria bacterium]
MTDVTRSAREALDKIEWKGDIKINEMISISLHKKTKNIAIHITASDNLNSPEKLDEINKGLKELALKINNPKIYPGFDSVTFTSWIVMLHDRLVKWLGFFVDYEGKDPRSVPMILDYYKRRGSRNNENSYVRPEQWAIEPLFASMARDKFVEKLAKDV